jgi:hypothetical protein
VNPLGNRAGCRAETGVPHVRAIASRPGPTLPDQTCPDLGEKETGKRTFQNGNTFRSAVRAEDTREARAKETSA